MGTVLEFESGNTTSMPNNTTSHGLSNNNQMLPKEKEEIKHQTLQPAPKLNNQNGECSTKKNNDNPTQKEQGKRIQELESNDVIQKHDTESTSELSAPGGKNHQNSRSSNNLINNENEDFEQPNSIIQDNFSHPQMKDELVRPKDVFDEVDYVPPPKHFDINIDLKTVFKDIRPIHEDYTNEEIEQRSMSMISHSSTKSDYELNFYRNGEEIRRSYIAKLIYKQVWKPSQKEKTHNSIIIFDWDDTLLCTSFLTPNGTFDDNMHLRQKDKEKIAKLELSVFKILTIALEKGDVYIVTNAGPGWVEFSAEMFYPTIKGLLSRIKIISARGAYEEKYPRDNRMWKILAFLEMQKTFNSELVTNIICLGDSFIEIEAGNILASKFVQAYIKTIKFCESPKPEELNKQLQLVANQFSTIHSTIKNLTISVDKKKNHAPDNKNHHHH